MERHQVQRQDGWHGTVVVHSRFARLRVAKIIGLMLSARRPAEDITPRDWLRLKLNVRAHDVVRAGEHVADVEDDNHRHQHRLRRRRHLLDLVRVAVEQPLQPRQPQELRKPQQPQHLDRPQVRPPITVAVLLHNHRHITHR